VNDLVLDASLALRWFLEDEADRKYSISVLMSLSTKRAVVPVLWFYEVGNALVMAQRRKRITHEQVDGFLHRLRLLPIDATEQTATEMLKLPELAQSHRLTVYDAAYLALALANDPPLATNDRDLRDAASAIGVPLL